MEHGDPAYTWRVAPDHQHECLHCGDVWLCLSDCLPLRLTLCPGCAERRQSDPTSVIKVVALETDEWTGSLARVLMAETEENIRRILRRRER